MTFSEFAQFLFPFYDSSKDYEEDSGGRLTKGEFTRSLLQAGMDQSAKTQWDYLSDCKADTLRKYFNGTRPVKDIMSRTKNAFSKAEFVDWVYDKFESSFKQISQMLAKDKITDKQVDPDDIPETLADIYEEIRNSATVKKPKKKRTSQLEYKKNKSDQEIMPLEEDMPSTPQTVVLRQKSPLCEAEASPDNTSRISFGSSSSDEIRQDIEDINHILEELIQRFMQLIELAIGLNQREIGISGHVPKHNIKSACNAFHRCNERLKVYGEKYPQLDLLGQIYGLGNQLNENDFLVGIDANNTVTYSASVQEYLSLLGKISKTCYSMDLL